MKRGIASVLATTLLGLGAFAIADDMPKGGQPQGAMPAGQAGAMDIQAMEMRKHLLLVDVYLSDAVNNTKAISGLSELKLEKKDKPIVDEAQKNIDTNLSMATTHIGHARQRGMAGTAKREEGAMERQPVAGVDPQAKLGELEQHLKAARDAAKKVKTARLEELDRAIEPVAAHLSAAEKTFTDLARSANYTRLEQMELGRVPVRGTEEQKPQPSMPTEQPGQRGGY
ncbi:MAG: hypothetical protein HY698_09485 [Deltaproteobacteria bacterium]|nr:hypothetical protein [Deltaproteobacteria bacterium]